MLLADGVYCFLYVTLVMFQNLTKGSFSVDLINTSLEIYQENYNLGVISGFLKQ